jgi:hypothetical protein
MNNKQAILIVLALMVGLLVPSFSVGMFFMGLAVGGFLVIILQ